MADGFEPRFADLVRIFTTTQGSDDFIIGAAVTGFRSFNSALEIGDRFYYCAVHSDRPSEREVGRGTLRADGKIAREPVGGNFTSFSPGTKTIALVAAAEWYDLTRQAIADAAAAAADAKASIVDAGASLTFTADAAASVGRPFLAKMRDCVSVKDFGAIGDGIADDSAAMAAAFQHGCTTGTPIFVPSGTYLVDPALLEMNQAAASFTLFGAGPSSVIKIKDGAITEDFRWMFLFAPASDMEAIEVRDLLLDHNARGSAPPAAPYDYQHSHSLYVMVPAGVTVKQVRFDNVVVKDPAADGFSNGGTGNIGSYVVANCAETDRTRVRSSVEFSRLPDSVLISGFTGAVIEIETNGASPSLKRFHISNSSVERLDLLAHPLDQAAKTVELTMDNVTTTVSAAFGDLLLRASNCRLRLPPDGRWNRLCEGSRISGSTILHPFDATANSIVSLYPLWDSGKKTDLAISNCDFAIDSADPAIAPSGAMVFPQSVPLAAEVGDQRLSISGCRFDPRCEIAVYAYRCGTVRLTDNRYGGRNAAIRMAVSANKGIDLTVVGGDFSRVTGAAISGGWIDVDQVTTVAYYRLSGDWTGVTTPYSNWSSAPTAARNNQVLSNRRLLMVAVPTCGLIGDVVEIQQPAEGKPDQYRCTVSSASGATWRMTRQAGVKAGATASRPALTASDGGCRYLDTSLAAAGKAISWTGSTWVDSTGAAA